MNIFKKVVPIVLTGLMIFSLAACGSSGGDKPTGDGGASTNGTKEILGDALTYNPNTPVNNGEKITITLWTDPEPQPYYEEAAEKYSAIHPNVTINVVTQPWSDYWTKLPLALGSGSGPDLYRAHEAHIPNIIQHSYELPEDVFPRDLVKQDFPTVDEALYDGKLYTIPLGASTGAGIYYNKAMWAEAGLTEADIPKTLAEFEEVGKKLVKKDANGNMTQYGFSIDHAFEGFINTLNYSQGVPLFQKDQVHYNLDNEVTYKNIEMIKRWKDDFMMLSDGDAEDQFGHGQTAMIGHWNWVAGYFNETYKEIDWGFFLIPTPDGNAPVAYDRMMNEWTLTVSSTDEAKRAVAFDFMKYYACEKNSYLGHAVRIGVVCANKNLLDDPAWDAYPNLKVIGTVVDRLVNIGVVPNIEALNNAMRRGGSDIFINGKDPKTVIQGIMKEIDDNAAKNNLEYKALEDQYEYYSEFK